ncbi:MAG: hypothetical protein ABSC15_11670 [Terriglobales bacterium]|jgi:hypothetical protein
MTKPSRYRDKPLLKLLECYVLWAIGQLSEADSDILQGMTPKLRSIYGVEGDWHQIITSIMELPPDMPIMIRELWAKNAEIARKNGAVLTPQEFSEMFVDSNLTR